MSTDFQIAPFEDRIILVDFDVNNPACKDDPFVRIGLISHWPLTKEEYAHFVSSTKVIGKTSEVFYGKEEITSYDIIRAFAEHYPHIIWQYATVELFKAKKTQLAESISWLQFVPKFSDERR